MKIFSHHPWGWSLFVFWIVWYWILFDGDSSVLANGLALFFPFLVTIAVAIGDRIGGERSNSAFWKGYYAGRQSEKQQLPYDQIPEDIEEVDFEYWRPKHTGQHNK